MLDFISGGQLTLTREEAAACGPSRFWTGRPHKVGHRGGNLNSGLGVPTSSK